MRAIILSVFAVVIAVASCMRDASAAMVFYQDPTMWSSASGFSGDLNGGQAGWLSQVGSAAQPFDRTVVRTDDHWQCETFSCSPLSSFQSTEVLSGLRGFSINFDSSAGSVNCTGAPLGEIGCSGITSTTFHLGGAIRALGATVTVCCLTNWPLSFDDFTFNSGFPLNYFARSDSPLTFFLGVVSDDPFESFTISTTVAAQDSAFRVSFDDILVASVDEPPTLFLYLVVLGFFIFWMRVRRA